MKKLLLIFLLLSCISTLSYSQSKTEIGVATEGSWFNPRPYSEHSDQNRNGWGAGMGVYASRTIFWQFLADIGLTYRYKQMQQYYVMPNNWTGGYGEAGNVGNVIDTAIPVEGWEKYDLHYVVLPIHLQLLTGKYFFIRGGIEASWLTNHDVGREKTEYNWTMGFGSQKHKLKWSLNFIRGFKGVGFMNGLYTIDNGKYLSATMYHNQMLQLNLSYPIWQK
jgi:hypothetical protein